MGKCWTCGKKMERESVPCPTNKPGCAVYHFRYVCKPCISTEKEKTMDLEHLRYDIDEELRKEEMEELKATAIAKGIRNFWRMNKVRQFIQGIKCVFGCHIYNRIPDANITTCPSCTRMWNNPFKGLKHKYYVNGSRVGYDDYNKKVGK